MKVKLLFLVLAFVLLQSQGNPADGKKVFAKMRCDTCHSAAVTSGGRTPHPLPDLTAQSPEQIKQAIVKRSTIRTDATLDEIAMASTASQLTRRELDDIVAYLRSLEARASMSNASPASR